METCSGRRRLTLTLEVDLPVAGAVFLGRVEDFSVATDFFVCGNSSLVAGSLLEGYGELQPCSGRPPGGGGGAASLGREASWLARGTSQLRQRRRWRRWSVACFSRPQEVEGDCAGSLNGPAALPTPPNSTTATRLFSSSLTNVRQAAMAAHVRGRGGADVSVAHGGAGCDRGDPGVDGGARPRDSLLKLLLTVIFLPLAISSEMCSPCKYETI